MASKARALIARIQGGALAGAPPAFPVVGAMPILPGAVPEARHYRFGRAQWPLSWVCDLTGLKKEGAKFTVELTDPKSYGMIGTTVTTATLGVAEDEGKLMLRADTPVALIALPMSDPRTEETFAALHAIWNGG